MAKQSKITSIKISTTIFIAIACLHVSAYPVRAACCNGVRLDEGESCCDGVAPIRTESKKILGPLTDLGLSLGDVAKKHINDILDHIPGVGKLEISDFSVNLGGNTRDCCPDKPGVAPIKGGYEWKTATLKVGIGIHDWMVLPFGGNWVPRKMHFTFAHSDIELYVGCGIYFGVDDTVTLVGGSVYDACKDLTDAGHDCLYGRVEFSVDPDLQQKFQIYACWETFFSDGKTCKGADVSLVDVHAHIAGGAEWHHDGDCEAKLSTYARIDKIEITSWVHVFGWKYEVEWPFLKSKGYSYGAPPAEG